MLKLDRAAVNSAPTKSKVQSTSWTRDRLIRLRSSMKIPSTRFLMRNPAAASSAANERHEPGDGPPEAAIGGDAAGLAVDEVDGDERRKGEEGDDHGGMLP